MEQTDALYAQYMAKAKQICAYLPYDNYLDYLYAEAYGRGYTKEDTDAFFASAYRYALSALTDGLKVYRKAQNKMTRAEKKRVDNILYGDAFAEGGFAYIEDYKNAMGGAVKSTFDGLFTTGGRYYITYEEDGLASAYQNEITLNGKNCPYVFYGTGYHDCINIVHEFGHYFASVQSNGAAFGYDLAETQSQSDEFLFIQFLLQNEEYDFSDTEKEVLYLIHYLNSVDSIALCAFVNEVEKRCYALETYELGDMERIINELYAQYPKMKNIFTAKEALSYVTYVTMYSPGYYISYSTSLLGALYIDKLASEDFAAAKEAYYKIVNPDEEHMEYRDAYEYAGLGDPFEEETFTYIFGE